MIKVPKDQSDYLSASLLGGKWTKVRKNKKVNSLFAGFGNVAIFTKCLQSISIASISARPARPFGRGGLQFCLSASHYLLATRNT